jgi:hypothetical protein
MRRLREAQLPLLTQQEQGDPDELDRTRSGRFLETPVPSRVFAHQQQGPERREHPLFVCSTDILVLREERLERRMAGPHPVRGRLLSEEEDGGDALEVPAAVGIPFGVPVEDVLLDVPDKGRPGACDGLESFWKDDVSTRSNTKNVRWKERTVSYLRWSRVTRSGPEKRSLVLDHR